MNQYIWHVETCFLAELMNSLREFVERETKEYQDAAAEAAIEAVRSGKEDVSAIVNGWTRAFSQVSTERKSHEKIFCITNHVLLSNF